MSKSKTPKPGSQQQLAMPRRAVNLLYRVWRDVSALADQCEKAGHAQLHRELYDVSERALLEYERHSAEVSHGATKGK